MFRFEHPEHLYALAILPVLVLFYLAMQAARERAIRRFGDSTLVYRLMPQLSKYKHSLKLGLLLLGLAFLIIGWANPQWGARREKAKRRSADIFIALDISQSMLAQDVAPNRLELAKRFVLELVRELRGDRVGLVIFAGNAYLQVPLTIDYAAAGLFVKSAHPDLAPAQGTAIVDAIDLVERSFQPESANHKALILISDGENHDQEALERARKARRDGLVILTVGAGTTDGSYIPVLIGGRQDFKRDQTGNPVLSKLDENLLRDLAKAGNGTYFNLSAGTEKVLEGLRNRMETIEKRELEQRAFTDYESYFPYFIGAGLFFLLLEFLLSYRKNRFWEGKDLFNV